MANISGLKALKAVIAKRKRASAKGVELGLKRAGLFLQRESQKVVPVDHNILRPTADTRAEGLGWKTEVVVSYGTDYAVFVHEDLEARHKPGKQAKFLEQPFRDNKDRLVEIVGEEIVQQTKK